MPFLVRTTARQEHTVHIKTYCVMWILTIRLTAFLPPVLHSFSLLEAARNTERRHVWSSDLKLRHAQIAFVSANRPHSDVIGDVNGNLSHEPLPGNAATRDTQGFSPEIRIADLSINTHIEHGVGTVPRIGMDIPVVSTDLVSQGGTAKELAHSCNEQHKVFASDTQRYTKDSRMESKLPPTMIPQSSSSDASDSSEEVIIFRGRDRSQRRLNRKSTSYASDLHQRSTSATRKPAPQYQPILPVISDVPIANAPNPDTSVSRKARLGNYASSDVFTDSNSIYKDKPLTNTSWNRATRPHESQEEQYEDEALEDYMKNIQENENIDQFLTEGQVSEGGLLISDTNIWGKMAAMNSETMMSENPPKTKAGVNWSEVNLHVIEELETCDKIPGIIDRVLLRRNRPSGVQYLVVSEGYTLDDARWVPFSSLDTPDAKEQLRVFEINSRTHSQPFIIGDDTDGLSSDLDKQAAIDLENEFDDMLDEEELLERKRRRMTDEQIARLLSKQEEFDLGSNELLLFGADGETEKSESESDCIHIIRARPTIFGSSMNKKEKNRQDRFAPASSFANSLDRDPYDGFDIMDRERPSINRKSKSNRGAARFGLSDSEMEVEMHLSWGKDREKKRMHKQERADLRNQGLLARKGKLDIKAKYRAGMSMEDVKKEIKDFLVSSTQR